MKVSVSSAPLVTATTSELSVVATVSQPAVIIVAEVSGKQGIPGAQGAGVPAGGQPGQRLVKKTVGDYDTEWADQTTSPDKSILFQDGDVVGGDPNFRWDKNTKSVILGNPDLLTNNPINIGGALDAFLQCNIQNTTEGTAASSDYVATADNGTDDDHYIDVGINSSVYDQDDFSATKANDGYVLVAGGDLVLGAISEDTEIVFAAGGATEAEIVATITADGLHLEVDKQVTIGGVEVATVTNRPEILFGTSDPPSPTGLADGTLYIRYTT